MFVWLTRMFDLLFSPFRTANPLYPVLAFSVVTGVLMVIAFRYTSNQPAIKRVKHRLSAHILEVRLFQDQLSVVWCAYGRILRAMLSYLGLSVKPLLVMIIPLVILLVQMDVRLGREPVRPDTSVLVEVTLADAGALDSISLHVPDGLTITAPPLRIPSLREVDWRLAAQRTGEFQVTVTVGGQELQKEIVVSEHLVRVPVERARSGLLGNWLHPAEPSLPADGPIAAIRVDYPPREVSVAGWKMHWLIPFFVFSLVISYAVKGFFRTEF